MKSGKLGKRLLSLFLAAGIVLGGAAVPKEETRAGIIAEALTGSWSKLAGDVIKRTVVLALGSAIDLTDNDELASLLSMVESLVIG